MAELIYEVPRHLRSEARRRKRFSCLVLPTGEPGQYFQLTNAVITDVTPGLGKLTVVIQYSFGAVGTMSTAGFLRGGISSGRLEQAGGVGPLPPGSVFCDCGITKCAGLSQAGCTPGGTDG